ncbi:hypothetical protein GCM10011579_097930 [Streptomyces albiflavescens]|uniref:Uncharacterized protein n=1 Tax=Streptomyces albiflavescens TaxID=1623582 RepID=A0A918DB01_9ACTN|nr:hypothetical protein [Streptomyces albiflavescens]GGN96444.1 hypothetical protein GCM10011579_097930 [Streptomyces albiflavescens]
MPEAEPAPRLFIGTRVTYHGRFTELHDRPLYVLPCTWFGHCDACWEQEDKFEERHPMERDHFMVVDLTTDHRVHHADRASLTPIAHVWPEDAVQFNINGYWYSAAYTTAGGSDRARTVHFYTAEEFIGRTWCHFRVPAPDVRRLDEQGRRRPVI